MSTRESGDVQKNEFSSRVVDVESERKTGGRGTFRVVAHSLMYSTTSLAIDSIKRVAQIRVKLEGRHGACATHRQPPRPLMGDV